MAARSAGVCCIHRAIIPNFVRGNATISGTVGTPDYGAFNAFCNTFVSASLTLQRNLAPFAVGDDDSCYSGEQTGSAGPSVGANMLVQSNRATIAMRNVHVSKILACIGNDPPPTDDGSNFGATAVGQCSTFKNG